VLRGAVDLKPRRVYMAGHARKDGDLGRAEALADALRAVKEVIESERQSRTQK